MLRGRLRLSLAFRHTSRRLAISRLIAMKNSSARVFLFN
jgi:hypothetical protein